MAETMPSDTALPPGSQPSADMLAITISHHGSVQMYDLPALSTITDLTQAIQARLSIDPSLQKFLIPKVGLLKPPYPNPNLPLRPLVSRKIQLLAPTPADLASLAPPPSRPPPTIKAATPARTRDHQRAQDEAMYTFHKLLPLSYMPNSDRSLRFLARLRDDAGVKAAMRRHKFSVPVLTEMDPAMHTTHESRTLGLNRNRGEVIELRLRTDAGDGYRDYGIIRKTLCHELAHNVWGDHDRNFWDLCKKIEDEVEKGDWKKGGRSVGEEEFYNPGDRLGEGEMDGGGWKGGDFVLGGQGSAGAGAGMDRREVLARAAEERMRRQREMGGGGGQGAS